MSDCPHHTKGENTHTSGQMITQDLDVKCGLRTGQNTESSV